MYLYHYNDILYIKLISTFNKMKLTLDDLINPLDNNFYHIDDTKYDEKDLYNLDELLDEEKFLDIMISLLNKNPKLFEKVIRKIREEKLKKLK